MRLPFAAAVALLWFAASTAGIGAEPIVRMLVPGFTVRELPVKLSNVNNLRFAPDGRLTTLGYDGRIWLLRDTDGDGLEDTAEPFWDKPTLSVPVGMAWSTVGLYVSSHGKVSLLRDTDGDGKADTEEIIASGWPSTDVGSGGVDATAVTVDREGNVYFGLLVADYSNAYRLRKRKDLKPDERAWLEARGDRGGDPEEQVSLYDIHSQRGTIQKWNKSTGKPETIATGLRVPYTLAFNRNGDLFNTDQEGETWMPNGNPLDELNHIIPGKNYGFPPRHEKWLPNLISEPPVVAFGPQHESTCGLVFNEPKGPLNPGSRIQDPESRLPASPAQGLFGPKWWEGDAFVAGESRGKIWRVRLVKTPHGYVGKEYLIARLSMLTMDLAISPKGDLYVCCHSGLPDWGTGPQGEGKIFKISYTDPEAPQPVIAWAAGPRETRVAFDKPLDPGVANTFARGHARESVGDASSASKPSEPVRVLTNAATIEFGEYVRAADRYEVLKPPYAVVKQQEATPRGKLNIVDARLDNDNQTLVLTTDRHPQTVTYALTIPGVKARGNRGNGETVDVDYDLHGVDVLTIRDPIVDRFPRKLSEAVKSFSIDWLNRDQSFLAWFPHPEFSVVGALVGSFENQLRSYPIAKENTSDRVQLLFRFVAPPDANQVRLVARKEIVQLNAALMESPCIQTNGEFVIEFAPGQLAPRETHVIMENRAFPISFTHTVSGDATPRPLGFSNFLYFWAPTNHIAAISGEQIASLMGGDFERGRDLFFSDQLKCATCHRIRGEGATIGPDLSNLVSRDAASVLRDIKEPSASINSDYVAYNVVLSDGSELSGFIREQDNASIKLLGADGKETIFRPTDAKEMRVSSVSLMPTGLVDALKEEQVRDLLTFLLNEPPKRDNTEIKKLLDASKPALVPSLEGKSNDDVRRALLPSVGGAGGGLSNGQALNIILVASKQDHGPGQHDYPAWQKKWQSLLGGASNVVASAAFEWPSQDQFQSANAIVFYYWNHDWNAGRLRQLDEFLAHGGGIVLLHSAVIGNDQAELLAERTGLASFASPRTQYRHMPLDLKIVAPDGEPITAGLPRQIHFLDEPYWPLTGDATKVEVLATTKVDGEDRPMIWTFQNGKGRVFGCILGHYTWTQDDPLFRLIALRGLAWAAGESATRFHPLATASQ